MSLQDKVALITGASNGIGAAIATHLSSLGARVVINYRSDAASADALAAACGGPDRALAVQADVSALAGIDALVAATVARFGRVDIAVANAGLMLLRTLDETSPDDWDRLFALNVRGPYFLAQKAAPHMPGGGRILLVSSGVCHNSAVAPEYLPYAASKGAVEQMARVMAKGLAARGIRVNAFAPGPTATDLFLEGKPEALLRGIRSGNPFGRLGEPDDVAKAVAFLCGEQSDWVVGQTLLVNGGQFV